MFDSLHELRFLRPFWFLALLPWGALIWRMLRRCGDEAHWIAVCDRALLLHMLTQRPGNTGRIGILLLAVCGVVVILALAGPSWERIPQPVYRQEQALVIALDLSASMNARDLRPSRLDLARYKIADLLRLRAEGQTALLVYAGEAFVVSPLTDDARTINAQLSALQPGLLPAAGSAANKALISADSLLRQAGNQQGHVLLVTDEVRDPVVRDRLRMMAEQGYRVSILAVGTAAGSPVPTADGSLMKDSKGSIVLVRTDHAELRRMAEFGGGRYVRLRPDDADVSMLTAFFANDGGDAAERSAQEDLVTEQWKELGPLLLLLVLPFAAGAFRRGLLYSLPLLAVLPFPAPAMAFEWEALWLNADQQAHRLLRQGEAEQAATLFKDRQWKAAASYHAGDYAAVLDSLADAQTADAWYNRGNALARLGRYPDAISAYDQALALAPGHEDASYNRELVKQALQANGQQGEGQQGEGQQGEGQQGEGQQGEGQQGEGQQSEGQQGEGQQGEGQQGEGQQGEGQQSEGQQGEGQQSEGQQGEGQQGEGQQLAEAVEEESGEQQAAESVSRQGTEEEVSETDPTAMLQQQEDAMRTAAAEDDSNRHGHMRHRRNRQRELQGATEQWLRRIPDDPGGLLRRKFQYQYQQRARQQPEPGIQPW